MEFEDFLEPEIAVVAAATAAITSPQVRRVLRRGVVYGLAGLLVAGDAITTFSKGVQRGVKEAAAPVTNGAARNTARKAAGGAEGTKAKAEARSHE